MNCNGDLIKMSTTLLILAEFGGISAERVAGSAEWVAGSAVKLGIFSDFWRGAIARAKNRKKCFKNGGGISAEIAPKFRRNGSAT